MTVFAAQQFVSESQMLPSVAARLAYRNGEACSTAGVANGFVQGNLAILPEKLAAAFHRFCQLNPKPCPINGMSDVGDPRIPALGQDLDIRTDVPGYRVWRDGEVVDEPARPVRPRPHSGDRPGEHGDVPRLVPDLGERVLGAWILRVLVVGPPGQELDEDEQAARHPAVLNRPAGAPRAAT